MDVNPSLHLKGPCHFGTGLFCVAVFADRMSHYPPWLHFGKNVVTKKTKENVRKQ